MEKNNTSNTRKTINITSVVVFLSIFTSAFLINTKVSKAQASVPLVVTPARQTTALDPGESKSLQVRFFNESSAPQSGKIGVVDFIVTGNDGKPVLLDNVDYPISNQYSASQWINLNSQGVTIAPGDVLRVNFKVSIPENARPGGRYVAIYFESEGQVQGNGTTNVQSSATSSRIVSLVYIRVNGPVLESAYIDVFKTPKFLQLGPIPVNFEIFNKGDYHITPKGQITLLDSFGKKIDQVTLEEKNIFPDAKRSYEENLGLRWMFGKYTVNLAASYGDTGKVLTYSQDVWIIPVLLILSVALGIGIVVLTFVLVNKRLKTKQRVLEQKLESEISEIESLKKKFKDQLPKK